METIRTHSPPGLCNDLSAALHSGVPVRVTGRGFEFNAPFGGRIVVTAGHKSPVTMTMEGEGPLLEQVYNLLKERVEEWLRARGL